MNKIIIFILGILTGWILRGVAELLDKKFGMTKLINNKTNKET